MWTLLCPAVDLCLDDNTVDSTLVVQLRPDDVVMIVYVVVVHSMLPTDDYDDSVDKSNSDDVDANVDAVVHDGMHCSNHIH